MADASVKIRSGASNATKLQSRDIDAAAPADTNVLAWSASDSEWEPTAASSGDGDVVGPSSAVDDRIVTFDSTTGKLVQDGGKTIAEVEAAAVSQWTDTGTVLHPTDSSGTVDSVIVGGDNTSNADIVLGVDGSAIFNQQAADVDFTVSAVGAPAALFVQGSDGSLGLANTAPNSILSLGGTPTITTDTTDGSDSKSLTIAGGGAASITRGAYLQVHGNEALLANKGTITLVAGKGDAASNIGDIRFFTGTSSTERLKITDAGGVGVGIDPATAAEKFVVDGAVALKSQSSAASATADYSKFFALDNGPAEDTEIKLLLHGQGADESTTFTDSSQSGHTPSSIAGNVQIDTDQRTLSQASSILFDGTGDYLDYADSTDWTLDVDFTVDFFVRFASLASGASNVMYGPVTFPSGESWRLLRHQDATNWQFSAGASMSPTYTYTSTVAINTWYHIATTRASGIIRTFQDGTQIGVDSSSNTTTLDNNGFRLGANYNAADPHHGWLQEFRITKGTALWTANFTPPAAPVGGTSEMWVLDEVGNETKLSSHKGGEWEYYSKSPKGEVTRINMEEVVRDLGELTGKDYIKDK